MLFVDTGPDPRFAVDSTGLITLRADIPSGYYDVDQFSLNVIITDSGSCCSNTPIASHPINGTVFVNLQGINTQPVFPTCYGLQLRVPELSPVNTTVTQVEQVY